MRSSELVTLAEAISKLDRTTQYLLEVVSYRSLNFREVLQYQPYLVIRALGSDNRSGLRWRLRHDDPRFFSVLKTLGATVCRAVSHFVRYKGVIEQLYTDPPEHSVVLCIDEMGPLASRTYEAKQLTKIHGPPAGRAKVELDYKHRPKGGFVFGALQPSTGAVLTQTYSRRIVGNYVEFLEKVEQWLPPEIKRVCAIVDNLYMHSAYDVMLFSLAYPRWEFVFQPKYAGYLNLIEPWWKTLRSLALKGRRFEVWTEMVEPVKQATDYWNKHKHPYIWGRRRRHRTPRKFGVATLPSMSAF